jgi:hypothetical protein
MVASRALFNVGETLGTFLRRFPDQVLARHFLAFFDGCDFSINPVKMPPRSRIARSGNSPIVVLLARLALMPPHVVLHALLLPAHCALILGRARWMHTSTLASFSDAMVVIGNPSV